MASPSPRERRLARTAEEAERHASQFRETEREAPPAAKERRETLRLRSQPRSLAERSHDTGGPRCPWRRTRPPQTPQATQRRQEMASPRRGRSLQEARSNKGASSRRRMKLNGTVSAPPAVPSRRGRGRRQQVAQSDALSSSPLQLANSGSWKDESGSARRDRPSTRRPPRTRGVQLANPRLPSTRCRRDGCSRDSKGADFLPRLQSPQRTKRRVRFLAVARVLRGRALFLHGGAAAPEFELSFGEEKFNSHSATSWLADVPAVQETPGGRRSDADAFRP